MKKLYVVLLLLLPIATINAQSTEKVWRINFLNPGVVLESPITSSTTLSVNVGVGYSGSYPKLTETDLQSGLMYAIVPFVDVAYRLFYNLDERANENRAFKNNSGNFVALRFKVRGPSITDNFIRKTSYDFAIGPTWGIQRSYGSFNLLIDAGPQLYFDVDGNIGFWPLMLQISVGYNL